MAYVPFRPEQIKLSSGNRGQFDPTDPDIRYQKKKPTAPTFYSAVARVVDEKMGGKASGKQPTSPAMSSFLPGGKRGRIRDKSATREGVTEDGDWARLAPRQRERIEQMNKKLMSDRNRDIIRDYHTKLAESK